MRKMPGSNAAIAAKAQCPRMPNMRSPSCPKEGAAVQGREPVEATEDEERCGGLVFLAQPEMPRDFRKWLALVLTLAAFSGLAAFLLILL